MADRASMSTQLVPADPQRMDALAANAAMVLAFALSGGALWLVEIGSTTVISLAAGFALLLSRLRRGRVEVEARLGLADRLELARLLLDRGAHGQARVIARGVAEAARVPLTQRVALETVAWCELGLGRPGAARDALSWIRASEELDAHCCAAVEDACGHSLWALRILETAAQKSPLTRQARLFWIDLCARVRGLEAACLLTARQLDCLHVDDAKRVLAAARDANCHGAPALELAIRRAAAGGS